MKLGPTPPLTRPRDYERFIRKFVISADGCWVWHKPYPEGYGRFKYCRRTQVSHRVAYATWIGPIPDGLTLDHLCRNRACVNPDHLEPVTIKENILRGMGRGAQFARMTHCPKGHPLSGRNLYVAPSNGRRRCVTCKNQLWRDRYRRRINVAILRDWNDTRSDLDEDFLRHAESDQTGTGTVYPKRRPKLRMEMQLRDERDDDDISF